MHSGRRLASFAALSFVLMAVGRAFADGPPPSRKVSGSPPAKLAAPDVGATASDPREGADPSSVFFVQRNKNAKEVHYGVRLDGECRPLGREPVYNYWVRPSKRGNVTEPLSFFQQTGYGLKSQKVSETEVEIVLKALPDRHIVVVPTSSGGRCRVLAYMQIASRRSLFEKAYVFAEEGLLLPTVKYIDLFGRADDGTPVTERLIVD